MRQEGTLGPFARAQHKSSVTRLVGWVCGQFTMIGLILIAQANLVLPLDVGQRIYTLIP